MSLRSLAPAGVMVLTIVAWTSGTWAQTDADPSIQKVDWPDTLAGRWTKELLEAYHAKGAESLRHFVNTHYSEAYGRKQELADLRMQRSGVPEFRVHAVTADGEYAVTVTAEAVLPAAGQLLFPVTVSGSRARRV